MGAPERHPAPDAERPGGRIRVDHGPVRPRLAAEDDRAGRPRGGGGVDGRRPRPREAEGEVGPERWSSRMGLGRCRGAFQLGLGGWRAHDGEHRHGPHPARWRQWRGGSGEERRVPQARVPRAALRVEDPEVGAPPRWSEPVAGDRHRAPLADDVAPEPDPARPAELEAEPARLLDGGGQPAAQATGSSTTSSVPARRASAASRRSRSATRVPATAGSRPSGRSRTSRSTVRPESSAPASDSASSRSTGVRTTSHSSRTPRATASTGSKVRARSSQATIAPPACASATVRSAAWSCPMTRRRAARRWPPAAGRPDPGSRRGRRSPWRPRDPRPPLAHRAGQEPGRAQRACGRCGLEQAPRSALGPVRVRLPPPAQAHHRP